jgi:hypothetical protein
MNQKILIVFTLFLLITILLLLLISNEKAKSERIQVLAYLPVPEPESGEIIKSFLEKLAYESNFVFTVAGGSDEWTASSRDSYSAVIRFLPSGYGEEETGPGKTTFFPGHGITQPGEYGYIAHNPGNSYPPVWIDQADRRLLHILIGQNASYCNDPDFLIQVRQAILQAAFSVH